MELARFCEPFHRETCGHYSRNGVAITYEMRTSVDPYFPRAWVVNQGADNPELS